MAQKARAPGWYLEATRTLDGEDEDDELVLQEGLGQLALVAGRGGPDPPLLGYF